MSDLRTADGYPITHGMRAWDNSVCPGTIDLAAYLDGWFYFNRDSGGRILMSADRVAVRNPFTGEHA